MNKKKIEHKKKSMETQMKSIDGNSNNDNHNNNFNDENEQEKNEELKKTAFGI